MDTYATATVTPPTMPGWYAYSGGRQTLIFLLDISGRWFAITDVGDFNRCEWGYIEQALGVWDLKLLAAIGGDSE